MEFKAYQTSNSDTFALNRTQVAMLMSSSFFERGMTNLYIASTFAIDTDCINQDRLKDWNNYYGIVDYHLFKTPMQDMIETYMFNGTHSELTVQEMLFGYEDPVFEKIIGTDFYWGDYQYLEREVTPVFNDQISTMKE